MDYKQAIEYWERLITESNLVERTLEGKDYEDILCRIEANTEENLTRINVYDYKNPQHYVILFKDGKIDTYGGLGNKKTLVEKMSPLSKGDFYDLTERLVGKALLKVEKYKMDRTDLFTIENYTILMQYLALGYKIKVNNGMAIIEIWMEDKYRIKGLNQNFKELPPYNYDTEMTLENVILGIIPQLKEQEPEEFKTFKNRWEEIKSLTLETVALNKMKEY